MAAHIRGAHSALGLLLLLALLPGAGGEDRAQGGQGAYSPQIAVVWPHDGQGRGVAVTDSAAVNVSVWPREEVPCAAQPDLHLMVAHNNEPTVPATGQYERVLREGAGGRFPSLEFNDVPADLAGHPADRYALVLYSEDPQAPRPGFLGNVWLHAADARTILPYPLQPTGYASTTSEAYDARIQVVWPHDAQGRPASVEDAPLVNVTVHVFEHGTTNAYPRREGEDFPFDLVLLQAQGNGPLQPVPVPPTQGAYMTGRRFYTQWTFNDVPVDPDAQTHLVARLAPRAGGPPSRHSTVWTHATDPRTNLPNPQEPPACTPAQGAAANPCEVSPLVVPLVVPWNPAQEMMCPRAAAPDGTTVGVRSLEAGTDSVTPGGALALRWEVEGADQAILEFYARPDIETARERGDATVAPLLLLTDLPTNGNRTLAVPDGLTGDLRVVLWGARRGPTSLPSPARVAYTVLDLPREP